MEDNLIWIIGVGGPALLIVAAVLAWQIVRLRSRARLEAESFAERLELQHAEDESRRQAEQAEARERHQQELAVVHSQHASELLSVGQKLDNERTLTREYAKIATYKVGWEWESAESIVRYGSSAGLNGVLATNVMFFVKGKSSDGPYVAQLDHVLITRQQITVIENKNWHGLVFDGRLPSQVDELLGVILPDSLARPVSTGSHGNRPGKINEFAIRAKYERSDNGRDVSILVKTGEAAPRRQVVRQAINLNQYLRDEAQTVKWVNSCVYYTGRQSRVVHDQESDADFVAAVKRSEPIVVADRGQLIRALKKFDDQGATKSVKNPVVDVADQFARLGAYVRGIGDYADQWPRLPSSFDC